MLCRGLRRSSGGIRSQTDRTLGPIGKSVEQDNVVRCFDCDSLLIEGSRFDFLVMEYVEGQTLRDLLNELERVPEELCRHIGREIAKGLVAIHEAGVIHRDLKPENVLITPEHVVKVMDLGVARLQDEVVRLSQTGAFVGSLEYACPEQFRSGGEEVDARSDLHALGVMLYELPTGQHPYRTDDTSTTLRNVIEGEARRAGEVNPQLSPFIEEVIHTLAAKEPDGRFASASTLPSVLEDGEKSEWWKERAKALRSQTKRPLRRIRIPRELAQALALLANLPGGDPAEAEAALQEESDAGNTPQTRYYLWKATGKSEHLQEAKRLLDYRVEHAPEEYRESLLKNVRLNREIMEAWEEHGEAGE